MLFNLLPRASVLGLILVSFVSVGHGMEIFVNFRSGRSVAPDGGLTDVVNHAAATWARRIGDSHTLTVHIWWADLGSDPDAPIADSRVLASSGGRPTRARIRFNVHSSFFVDPTPLLDEEFDMVRSVVALTPGAGASLTGSPPAVLEVGYSGSAKTSGAIGVYDLLTVALHELGHAIGYVGGDSEFSDGDLDLHPTDLTATPTFAATVNPSVDNHLVAGRSVMHWELRPGRRKRPSALDVLAVAKIAGFDDPRPRRISIMDLYGTGTGNWSNADAWIGGRRPDSLSAAYLEDPDLDEVLLTGSQFAASVRIAEANALLIGVSGSGDLSVDRQVEVFGSQLSVLLGSLAANEYLFAEGSTIVFLDVDVANEGAMILEEADLSMNGATVRARTDLHRVHVQSPSSIVGFGEFVNLKLLRNHGLIETVQGPPLIFRSGTCLQAFDLSGPEETGELSVVTNSQLIFEGYQKNQFHGLAIVRDSAALVFRDNDLGCGGSFQVGARGHLDLRGGSTLTDAASVSGGHLLIYGNMTTSGYSTIASNFMVLEGSDLTVGSLGGSAVLAISGDTLFYESSSWDGSGTVRQEGDVFVVISSRVGSSGSSLIFDLDGLSESNRVTVREDQVFELHVSAIEFVGDGYDGELVIEPSGTFDVAPDWRLDGTATIASVAGDDPPAISGGDLEIQGTLAGSGEIEASVTNAGQVVLEGDIDVTGNYLQTGAGALTINGPGTKLTVSGLVTLSGDLQFDIASAAPGDEFVIIEGGSIFGTFASVSLPSIPGVTLEVEYGASAVIVRARP